MQIIKELRRSIVITVKENGEVVVKAPLFLSMKEINKFIERKTSWIEKQQQKIQQKEEFLSEYDFVNKVYINANAQSWQEVLERDRRTTKASFYSKKFEEIILKKANDLAKNNHVQFKLCNSRSIWGSCNVKRVIKLNWKLVILPENLQNYVICHELSHLKEMNHSKKFWSEVEKLDNNYKEHRKKLKNYAFLLRTEVLK